MQDWGSFAFLELQTQLFRLVRVYFTSCPITGQSCPTLVTHSFSLMPPSLRAPVCMGETGELHKLISVVKADKIPFSSFQRSLFSSCLVGQPTLRCSHCLPACLQETFSFPNL